jgi:hypothetical protein
VGGIVCAFSTIGVALLAMSGGLIFLLSGGSARRLLVPRLLVTVMFLGLAWPAALYTPYIGLKDKEVTHSTSVSDRSESVQRSLKRLEAHPFGTGLFSGTELNDGISLLAQLGMLGLFGFACQVLILSAWRPGVRINWAKMGACSPILLTALLSQPIAGAPTVYVILLAYLPRLRQRAPVTVRKPRPTLAEVLASTPVFPDPFGTRPTLADSFHAKPALADVLNVKPVVTPHVAPGMARSADEVAAL